MEQFSNAQTFANNFNIDEKISKKLFKLELLTAYSRLGRIIYLPLYNVALAKDNKDFDYVFNYNGKKYPFSVLSNRKLQNIDKKIL